MFNRHSIFFSLSIGLIISIVLVVISFLTLLEHDKQHYIQNIEKKYFPITNLIDTEYLRYGLTNNLQISINDMGFELIKESKKIDTILKDEDTKFIYQKQKRLHLVILFSDEQKNYLYFQTPFEEFMIVDKNNHYTSDKTTIIVIFTLVLFILISLSFITYKKLSLLNLLKNKVKKLGDGEKNINFDFVKKNGKDEVSLLAHEFKNTTNKLNQIKDARNIFIRNIMHELKTPITKGKFLVELPTDEKNKELLKSVFYRLESLISEFATVEEIIAKKNTIELKKYHLIDIIDNAIDLLYLDESKVIKDIADTKIEVNFKLFSIAIKNLIDNGIKYSKEKKVEIKCDTNKLEIINIGEKLRYPLDRYFEPFNKNDSNTDSFGLGLYIVHNILNAHNLKLQYRYEDGKNIFFITL